VVPLGTVIYLHHIKPYRRSDNKQTSIKFYKETVQSTSQRKKCSDSLLSNNYLKNSNNEANKIHQKCGSFQHPLQKEFNTPKEANDMDLIKSVIVSIEDIYRN
jgi:hypothetical protein